MTSKHHRIKPRPADATLDDFIKGLSLFLFVWPGFILPQRVWGRVLRFMLGWRSAIIALMPWFALAMVWALDALSVWVEIGHDAVAVFGSVRLALTAWASDLFGSVNGLAAIVRYTSYLALYLFAVFSQSVIWLGPLHLLIQACKPRYKDDSHGSAAWGTAAQAMQAKRLFPQGGCGGIMLGHVPGKLKGGFDDRYRVGRHVLTCAATGAGKGVGGVIPNLLDYPGAVVCLDIKGENYAVTAQARERFGQSVFCLDPFGITGSDTHSLNWLDAIDVTDEGCIAEAATLADTLVVRGTSHDSYWDDAAASLLQGLMLYVASLPAPERHMGTVRAMLTSPQMQMQEQFSKVAQQTNLAFSIAARAVGGFLAKADRERSSVLSTALRHTAFLDDPRIVRVLKRSDINFATFKQKPTTVYIVLPPDKLAAYNRFARATISLAIQAMLTPGRPRFDVLFLLDEFAQLGHFAAIENNLAILRGYGMLLWLLVQDLSQLQGVYAKWSTFLANTVLQAFGTQDLQTARYLSEMLGQTTQQVTSHSQGMSRGPQGHNTSSNQSQSALGRALLTPDEVRRLHDTDVLVFERGHPPYFLHRLDYRTDPQTVRELVGKNPMHQALGVHTLRSKPAHQPHHIGPST